MNHCKIHYINFTAGEFLITLVVVVVVVVVVFLLLLLLLLLLILPPLLLFPYPPPSSPSLCLLPMLVVCLRSPWSAPIKWSSTSNGVYSHAVNHFRLCRHLTIFALNLVPSNLVGNFQFAKPLFLSTLPKKKSSCTRQSVVSINLVNGRTHFPAKNFIDG